MNTAPAANRAAPAVMPENRHLPGGQLDLLALAVAVGECAVVLGEHLVDVRQLLAQFDFGHVGHCISWR